MATPTLEPGLAASELVADEQLLDDPVHLLLVEELVGAPPLFELEEALALLLRRGEDIVILAEIVAARVGHFETGDHIGPVVLAVAQVRKKKRRQPSSHHAAVVAQRIFAELAGPGGDRRAVDDDRPGDLGIAGGHDHGRPAALAIAHDDGLRRLRMPPADFRDEFRLGMHHVSQGLPRLGMLAEHHEIHGVAVMQRDADLAVGPEAADSGAETRARFDDHEGALPFVDFDALGRKDS